MKCAVGLCGHCQLGPTFICKDGPVFRFDRARPLLRRAGAVRWRATQARSSPSGSSPPATAASSACSTARTSCWPWPARSRSPTSPRPREPCVEGPYDLSLVEGSITTAARRRAHPARCARSREAWSPSAPAPPPAASRRCATSRTCSEFISHRLRQPEYIDTLATSTPIADHVPVDFELRGCPINKHQLLEVISAFLHGPQAEHRRRTASASSASGAATSA